MTYRSCIDSMWMSYRCLWISHRAYINRISIHISCMSVSCRFVYVVYKSYIDVISILYRFSIGVISMYIDCTPSAFKSYIDSYMLYTSTNAQVKRFGQGQAKSTHRLAQRLSCPVFWAAARRARSNLVDLVACARGRARSIPGQREFSV